MHLDIQTMFADQFDLTTAVFGAAVTFPNSIDLGVPGAVPAGFANTAGSQPFGGTGTLQSPPNAFQGPIGGPLIHDIGRGRRIPIFAQITVTVLTSASLTIDLVTADDGPLTTNKTVILSTGAVALAKLVAGYRFRLGVVPKGISQRFLGMQVTAATATATAGKMTAALALDDNDHADILG